MLENIKNAWPLFFGIAMVMIGNGLQGTLLGVRATMEGFDTATTGLIMSLYYGGFLAGSVLAPKLVKNVGHIRVFTALASLASTTALLHGLFVDPITWCIARVIAGFCFAGLYIVVESWLNDLSSNENRGKILGAYLLTFYGAMVIGQYLLNVSSPENITLFILISILISLALLPISLSKRPAPSFEAPKPTGIKDVYSASPLGVVSVCISGMSGGIIFGLGPVYASNINLNVSEVANFMAFFVLGGMIAQFPLGLLSDKIERRRLIIYVSLGACVVSLLCSLYWGQTLILYGLLFLLGMFALSIYALSVAYTNDYLEREAYVGASATLILMNGCGAFVGPFIASILMMIFGPEAFFPSLALIFSGIYLFAVYRSKIREQIPIEEQGDYVSVGPRATTITAQIAEESEEDDDDDDHAVAPIATD